jgi:hypothetical protein
MLGGKEILSGDEAVGLEINMEKYVFMSHHQIAE